MVSDSGGKPCQLPRGSIKLKRHLPCRQHITCRSLVSRERCAAGSEDIGISLRWDRRFLLDLDLRDFCEKM